jgi:hypothetical protein
MDRKARHRIWKLEKRLSKTEKLLAAALAKEEQKQERLQTILIGMRRWIRLHATAVAAIVIWGEPKIDEPVICAWRRTLAYHGFDGEEATETGLLWCERDYELRAAHKLYPLFVDDPDYGRPDSGWNPDIVHAPESARFTEVFKAAPVWLLEFTSITLDAIALEFDLPDLSDKPSWGVEGMKDAQRWPLLPLGTIAAGDPVSPDDGLSSNERRFYEEIQKRPKEEWSRFERRRVQQLVMRLSPNAQG